MQTTWITRGESDKLLVVALGWAADPSMVGSRDGFDTVCVYDYRTIEPLTFSGYREVHLIAWSYGVWAAEHIFSGQNFDTAVAVNGTPYPMSEKYGIPQRLFELTVKNLDIVKFAQRMCVGMAQPIEIKRDEAECHAELRALGEQFKRDYTPCIAWTKAIIGMRDMIYPPQTQQRYWSEMGVEQQIEEGSPHFIRV